MITPFSASIRQPVHLIDQVDVLLNLAEEYVDFDSDFDDLAPKPMSDLDANARPHSRSSASSRNPARRPRGLAEVAAEVSGRPD